MFISFILRWSQSSCGSSIKYLPTEFWWRTRVLLTGCEASPDNNTDITKYRKTNASYNYCRRINRPKRWKGYTFSRVLSRIRFMLMATSGWQCRTLPRSAEVGSWANYDTHIVILIADTWWHCANKRTIDEYMWVGFSYTFTLPYGGKLKKCFVEKVERLGSCDKLNIFSLMLSFMAWTFICQWKS